MAINGRNYGSMEPEKPVIHTDTLTSSSKAVNLGKIFGIMFIWLLFTAGIAFGGGYLSALWLVNNYEQASGGLLAILIASGISLIILTFIIQYFALKKGKGMIVLSSIYVLLMGVICSTLTLYIPWNILGMALGITTVIFGVLATIGLLAKNVKPIAMIGMMVIFGAAITALFTWLFSIWMPIANPGLYWIIDFAFFGGMLLLIIVDMNNIGKICESGQITTNITLYCALTIYTDFIYIFIKIAYYLAIIYGNSK